LEVHPIPYLDGSSHFNEVVLNDVYVPDELVLGEVGMGWAQNTSELAYERGGPDRWLSTYLVVENWLREHADDAAGERGLLLLGDVVARWWGCGRCRCRSPG
jgi:alkylation response protein AidB-like acyl-CoA dehydrogenase